MKNKNKKITYIIAAIAATIILLIFTLTSCNTNKVVDDKNKVNVDVKNTEQSVVIEDKTTENTSETVVVVEDKTEKEETKETKDEEKKEDKSTPQPTEKTEVSVSTPKPTQVPAQQVVIQSTPKPTVKPIQAPVVVSTPTPVPTTKPAETPKATPKPTQVPVTPKPTAAPTPTPQPAHTHDYKPVYKAIRHEAEYKTVHHDAIYETKKVPKEREYIYHTYQCPCGATFNTIEEAQAHVEATLNEMVPGMNITFREALWSNDDDIFFTALNYYPHMGSLMTNDHVGYETYYVEEQVLVKDAWDEQILVKAAWDEKIVDHYECSCGHRK